MKYLCFFSILFLSSFNMNENISQDFEVFFEQNNIMIEVKNNKVILNKNKDFNIILKFKKPMGVLVNASFKKQTFKLAQNNTSFNLLPGFKETGMAESLFNEDNEIIIDNFAPSYWYYDTINNHRFNNVEIISNNIICKRNIKSVYVNKNKSNISLNKLSSLYLVFISSSWNLESFTQQEHQRAYFEIILQ